MDIYSWRKKDDLWQKRNFLLSSIVRLKKPVTSFTYEFVDYLIDQGYNPPLGSLTEVDVQVQKLYEEYIRHGGGH
jgi:hypothetical protein